MDDLGVPPLFPIYGNPHIQVGIEELESCPFGCAPLMGESMVFCTKVFVFHPPNTILHRFLLWVKTKKNMEVS